MGGFVDSVSDFAGDIIDTGGDILGGVGDVIGDVAGGIGDLVGDLDIGDALQAFVLSGGNPYAAAIAATDIDESLGFNPGSFMSGDFSSFGAENIGGGGFDFGAPDLGGFDTSGLGDFSDYLQSAGDFANLPNLGENLGDIVNYADLVNQGGGDFMDYLQTGVEQGGDFTDYLSKLEDFNKLPDIPPRGIGDIVQGGLDDAIEMYKKYGKPVASIAKLITSYQAGQLSKKQQEELNRFKQAQYDEQRRKQEEFQNKIERGELAKLDIRRGETPTVRMARGGITNIRPKTSLGIMGVNR